MKIYWFVNVTNIQYKDKKRWKIIILLIFFNDLKLEDKIEIFIHQKQWKNSDESYILYYEQKEIIEQS